ncbi:hypothetical protein EMIT0373P_30373 [Pseudomonas chlororaphis]
MVSLRILGPLGGELREAKFLERMRSKPNKVLKELLSLSAKKGWNHYNAGFDMILGQKVLREIYRVQCQCRVELSIRQHY